MALPRDLIEQVRRLDEPSLRRLMILARGLLIGSDGPVVELDDLPDFPAVRYRQQRVRCGKRCAACPHGPYWYAFWSEGGRTRSQYIGAHLPAEVSRILQAHDRASPD